MLYFTRQLYVNDGEAVDEAEQDYAKEDYDAASKAYLERLDEIRDELPKSVRKLLDDKDWTDASFLRFVDDHFYIVPAEELNVMLTHGDHLFIVRYSVEELPTVEAPSEEEKPYFEANTLKVMEEEWDIEDGNVVHRLLLNNGYIVKYKPKAFRWWKVKVEAEA